MVRARKITHEENEGLKPKVLTWAIKRETKMLKQWCSKNCFHHALLWKSKEKRTTAYNITNEERVSSSWINRIIGCSHSTDSLPLPVTIINDRETEERVKRKRAKRKSQREKEVKEQRATGRTGEREREMG